MFGDEFADADLVGLGRRGGEGERDLAEAQFEQPVSAARLAIIVSLRGRPAQYLRSEEHTSELQSLMRISYAVFCLKKKNKNNKYYKKKRNSTNCSVNIR